MGALIFASCFVAVIFQVLFPFQVLSEPKVPKETSFIFPAVDTLPRESPGVLDPPVREIIDNQCREVPTGIGIPAFQPGIAKKHVVRILGVPTGNLSGYWPNTRAVFYELIPEEVSLGFLFDKQSEVIRQTEASFAMEVDFQIVLLTLNGMLGCRLNEEIKHGLQQVWQKNSPKYYLSLDSLKGVIEWKKKNYLYIGIWEADLH
ncbi:hypothetical protein [Lyngbya aestuarii]|uniref:hypothetical protein n=1 Tax=Lyngbya aestuarii TaxID=118322 RepID=UPI00403E1092